MSTDSDYGVRSNGEFRKKTVEVIREEMREAFKEEMGADFEFRPNSPLQQIIDAAAIEIARQWDAAEAAYYASFYEDSFGEQLDKQLALAGFSRRQLRGATGEVTFKRDSPASRDITIEEGTEVTTRRTEVRPPIPFQTTEEVILDEGQTEVTAEIEAQSPWQTDLDEEWLGEETNVTAGAIERLPDPVSGIDEVENEKPTGDEEEGFTEGRDRESDARFKLRYESRRAAAGVSTVPAMESSILNHDDDIVSAQVDEVHDSEENEYGPEPTVFAPGVDDDVIAQAIFESRAGGLESFGDETGVAEDDDGVEWEESFNRAEEVTVYVDVEVTVEETFSSDDGPDSIRDRLIRFVGGEDSDGDLNPGLEIGEDVYRDQLFRQLMDERGVLYADTFEIGSEEDELSEDDIEVSRTEAAMTDADYIDVTVNEVE